MLAPVQLCDLHPDPQSDSITGEIAKHLQVNTYTGDLIHWGNIFGEGRGGGNLLSPIFRLITTNWCSDSKIALVFLLFFFQKLVTIPS